MAHPSLTHGIARPSIEILYGAAWLIGIAATLRLVDIAVADVPMAAAILGATIVVVATKRAGLAFSDLPEIDPPLARPISIGVMVGLSVSAVVVFAALALGATTQHGHPSIGTLLLLIKAISLAARDELLLHGLPIYFARRAGLSTRNALGFAVLTAPAAIAASPGLSPEALALSVASGLLFVILWHQSKTPLTPIAAHATWGLAIGGLLQGEFVTLAFPSGTFSLGPRASGWPALVCGAACLGAAVVLIWRRRTNPDDNPLSKPK